MKIKELKAGETINAGDMIEVDDLNQVKPVGRLDGLASMVDLVNYSWKHTVAIDPYAGMSEDEIKIAKFKESVSELGDKPEEVVPYFDSLLAITLKAYQKTLINNIQTHTAIFKSIKGDNE